MHSEPRLGAFLHPMTEVFHTVQHQHDLWKEDPFDVRDIHLAARQSFERLILQATTPPGINSGRILLLRGEAGSGKTHLLRAFRSYVHSQGIGYFGYMQMTTSSRDYGRYMLQKLMDSLEQPYWHPQVEASGLRRLSNALAAKASFNLARAIEDGDLHGERLAERIHVAAEEILAKEEFEQLDKNVLRALLYLQSDSVRVRTLAKSYLRCEQLSNYEQTQVAALAPRLERDDPLRVVSGLGRIMWACFQTSLVLGVDQLESLIKLDDSAERFSQAAQALTTLVEEVPCSVVVVACLKDYYTAARSHLLPSTIDRIEQDPAPIDLQAPRSARDVERLVSQRLHYLYELHDLSYDEADPTFPIPANVVTRWAGLSARGVLEECIRFREGLTPTRTQPTKVVEPDEEQLLIAMTQRWNDFLANWTQRPPELDVGLAAQLGVALASCADDLGARNLLRAESNEEGRIEVDYLGDWELDGVKPKGLLVALCNRGHQRGALGRQLESLPGAAYWREPVAVRATDFPGGPKSVTANQLRALTAAGGRWLVIEDADWRRMAAFREFQSTYESDPVFDRWRRAERPLAQLPSLRELLRLDSLRIPAPPAPAPPPLRASTGIQEPDLATAELLVSSHRVRPEEAKVEQAGGTAEGSSVPDAAPVETVAGTAEDLAAPLQPAGPAQSADTAQPAPPAEAPAVQGPSQTEAARLEAELRRVEEEIIEPLRMETDPEFTFGDEDDVIPELEELDLEGLADMSSLVSRQTVTLDSMSGMPDSVDWLDHPGHPRRGEEGPTRRDGLPSNDATAPAPATADGSGPFDLDRHRHASAGPHGRTELPGVEADEADRTPILTSPAISLNRAAIEAALLAAPMTPPVEAVPQVIAPEPMPPPVIEAGPAAGEPELKSAPSEMAGSSQAPPAELAPAFASEASPDIAPPEADTSVASESEPVELDVGAVVAEAVAGEMAQAQRTDEAPIDVEMTVSTVSEMAPPTVEPAGGDEPPLFADDDDDEDTVVPVLLPPGMIENTPELMTLMHRVKPRDSDMPPLVEIPHTPDLFEVTAPKEEPPEPPLFAEDGDELIAASAQPESQAPGPIQAGAPSVDVPAPATPDGVTPGPMLEEAPVDAAATAARDADAPPSVSLEADAVDPRIEESDASLPVRGRAPKKPGPTRRPRPRQCRDVEVVPPPPPPPMPPRAKKPPPRSLRKPTVEAAPPETAPPDRASATVSGPAVDEIPTPVPWSTPDPAVIAKALLDASPLEMESVGTEAPEEAVLTESAATSAATPMPDALTPTSLEPAADRVESGETQVEIQTAAAVDAGLVEPPPEIAEPIAPAPPTEATTTPEPLVSPAVLAGAELLQPAPIAPAPLPGAWDAILPPAISGAEERALVPAEVGPQDQTSEAPAEPAAPAPATEGAAEPVPSAQTGVSAAEDSTPPAQAIAPLPEPWAEAQPTEHRPAEPWDVPADSAKQLLQDWGVLSAVPAEPTPEPATASSTPIAIEPPIVEPWDLPPHPTPPVAEKVPEVWTMLSDRAPKPEIRVLDASEQALPEAWAKLAEAAKPVEEVSAGATPSEPALPEAWALLRDASKPESTAPEPPDVLEPVLPEEWARLQDPNFVAPVPDSDPFSSARTKGLRGAARDEETRPTAKPGVEPAGQPEIVEPWAWFGTSQEKPVRPRAEAPAPPKPRAPDPDASSPDLVQPWEWAATSPKVGLRRTFDPVPGSPRPVETGGSDELETVDQAPAPKLEVRAEERGEAAERVAPAECDAHADQLLAEPVPASAPEVPAPIHGQQALVEKALAEALPLLHVHRPPEDRLDAIDELEDDLGPPEVVAVPARVEAIEDVPSAPAQLQAGHTEPLQPPPVVPAPAAPAQQQAGLAELLPPPVVPAPAAPAAPSDDFWDKPSVPAAPAAPSDDFWDKPSIPPAAIESLASPSPGSEPARAEPALPAAWARLQEVAPPAPSPGTEPALPPAWARIQEVEKKHESPAQHALAEPALPPAWARLQEPDKKVESPPPPPPAPAVPEPWAGLPVVDKKGQPTVSPAPAEGPNPWTKAAGFDTWVESGIPVPEPAPSEPKARGLEAERKLQPAPASPIPVPPPAPGAPAKPLTREKKDEPAVPAAAVPEPVVPSMWARVQEALGAAKPAAPAIEPAAPPARFRVEDTKKKIEPVTPAPRPAEPSQPQSPAVAPAAPDAQVEIKTDSNLPQAWAHLDQLQVPSLRPPVDLVPPTPDAEAAPEASLPAAWAQAQETDRPDEAPSYERWSHVEGVTRALRPPVEAKPPIPETPKPARPAAQPAPPQPTLDRVFLGTLAGRRDRPAILDAKHLTKNMAFIGGAGSGKTTAALAVVEQLLLRGIPAILLDRRGNLCSYAQPDAWTAPLDNPSHEAGRQRLRDMLDVAVFTPGHTRGRMISLPVVPNGMLRFDEAERELVARTSTTALVNMMKYGTSFSEKAATQILLKAIERFGLSTQPDLSMARLLTYLEENDPNLEAALGKLDEKAVTKLIHDLELVRINKDWLLRSGGEPLDVDALLGLGENAEPGRVRMSIITTKFLGEGVDLEFWVGQFMAGLTRWVNRNPSPSGRLRGVLLIDDAELYLPATGVPATRHPIEILLHRARTAGLAVFLASQNPGELDYSYREFVRTWVVGQVRDSRALGKMTPMFEEARIDIRKLETQEPAEFHVIADGVVQSIRALPNMVPAIHVPEDQILLLSASTRPEK